MVRAQVLEAGSAIVSRRGGAARHESRSASSPYGWHHRVERLIAGTRLTVTLCALLAIIVDPSAPVGDAPHVLGIVLAYALYSMISMVWSWLSAVSFSEQVRLGTQIFDVGAAIVIVSLAGGTYSPFFVFMLFPLLSTSLRWQWRGAVWTGASLLVAYGGVALYTVLGGGRVVHANSLIIEGVYLVVVTLILAYVGYHNDRIQREVNTVAACDHPQNDAADGRGEAALALERARIAREVHDGALQSLTAAGLRLETIRYQLDDGDQTAALDGLHELQATILLQQRELRSFVRELQTGETANDLGLGDLLTTLAFRIQQEWQLAVKLDLNLPTGRFEASISSELAREIHQIVREALVNTARHTLASLACVSVRLDGDWVRIKVADNGQGFPFRGRFEDVELAEGNLGPVMLRQRIAALGGRLTIDTSDDGATLEISLPRHGTIHGADPAAPRPYPSSVSLRSGPLSPA
jgi:signal transduction histidine kinase